MKISIIAVVLVGIFSGMVCAGEVMTFDDLYGFDQVGDVQLSPDGSLLAYTLRHRDLKSNQSSTYIYILPLDGRSPRRLQDGESSEFSPRWSPDGRYLLFTARGDAGSQLFLISPNGGQARRITDLSTGASSPVWSGDNNRLVYTSAVHPDCPDDDCNRITDSLYEDNPVQARLYDDLLFRHYNSWSDGKRNHLFLTDTLGSVAVDLTPGDRDVPPVAGAGRPSYAISPDGTELCFSMNPDSNVAVAYGNDLYTIPITGGEPVRLTTNPGNDCSPLYSPDGKYLIYQEMARAGYESDQRDIIAYDRQAGTGKNLTADYDRSVGEMIISPDSKYIYFTAVDLGYVGIYRVAVRGSKILEILADGVYGDLSILPDGNMLYCTRSTSTEPTEIYSYNLKNKTLQRMTYYTKKMTDRVKMSPSEEFWFYSVDSLPIQGFLTYPPDFRPEKKYPLVLLIHGGPQWCWLNDFNYYGWNTHLTAAQGYIVAQINPRGSRGYGREFCDAVSGDWGGKDYQDLMRGLDYLIDRFDYIDATRLAALGRSYGGYMVNWICGQTDRFACLVTVDGVFDNIGDYYSTEELWFPEWEFAGTPWTNRELYRERSPEKYVANFSTPTLVIHGQKDYRVDISQGIGMFTALQRRGVESQFLYFPDEGHMVHKLQNLRYVYDVQFDWLARFLK